MTSTPQEITYSEIRKGDTIRVTETYPSGFQNIQIGVAEEHLNEGFVGDRWLSTTGTSQNNVVLVAKPEGSSALLKQIVELVERPKVPLPTEHGTIIRITEVSTFGEHSKSVSSLAILDTDGEWCMFEFPHDVGCDYFSPNNILSWNRVEITDLPHSNN